jgi:tetratricopeptide (TPR) repeat protein
MNFVGIENRIRSGINEYLLKTSNDFTNNRIVSVLFKDGEVTNTFQIDYSENGNKGNVSNLVNEVHNDRREYIEQLLHFSSKIIPSMNNALWRDRLGIGFYSLNMNDEAILEFKKAIKLDPEYSIAYNHLGRSLISENKTNLSVEYFEIAAKQKPDYADFQQDLADSYLRVKRCRDAYDSASGALKINVYFARAYYTRAKALLLNSIKKEDYELSKNFLERVKEDLSKAVSIDPSLKNENYKKAWELLSKEGFPQAYELLEEFQIIDNIDEVSLRKLATHLKFMTSFENVSEEEIRETIRKHWG